MKVEILKYPTEQDWQWCKTCTLNTVGKYSTKAPTDEWKKKLIEAEHSPLRELWFGIRMEVPYWVSVHYVRHHIGVNHYVQSQRNDRQDKYDRTTAPQGEMVSHIMSINAQELVFMAHKRLCGQASKETREVMEETGLKVTESKYLFSLPNIYRYSRIDIHTLDMFFECKVEDESVLTANDDAAECMWIAPGDIHTEQFGLRSVRWGLIKFLGREERFSPENRENVDKNV